MRQRRLQLMQSLFDEYIEMYAARDDKLTARFSDTFSGYAGSSDILVTSKDEWVKITRQDFAQVPERIHIEVLDLSLQDLAEDIIVITAFFHIHLPIPDSILSQETARLVLIFRQESNDWKIVHSGISIPYGLAKQGEIYPMTSLEERNRELESIIQARTYELAEANNRLEKLSNTDGLTNIGNRRLFDQMLQKEWSRGQRNNTPLSRGRSKFCVRLIFKFPARYLNVLQNKSLTEINKGSNCGLAWSIYLRRLICLRKVASTSYFH